MSSLASITGTGNTVFKADDNFGNQRIGRTTLGGSATGSSESEYLLCENQEMIERMICPRSCDELPRLGSALFETKRQQVLKQAEKSAVQPPENPTSCGLPGIPKINVIRQSHRRARSCFYRIREPDSRRHTPSIEDASRRKRGLCRNVAALLGAPRLLRRGTTRT